MLGAPNKRRSMREHLRLADSGALVGARVEKLRTK
jgi:hypothetical protein